MLELAILGLLKESDLHGYELKKRLTEALGPFSSVSFGSLYPALARLEAAGAVKAVEARDAVPEIGSPSLGAELAAFHGWHGGTTGRRGGRSRKVYGITPRGHQLFQELLAADDASTDDDRLFNLRLAFARYLPPEARLGMLERRRAALVERLAAARARMRAGRERFDTYTRSLAEHGTEATERDISWLDRLIAAEQAGHDAAPRQEEHDQ
ncbi:MAG TPA: PadR family transcriptional regulator [Acidimicrobiales bacterium]|nr:PadR family transcriptional regulator [Acidimicrobiales bacterium]